MIINQTEHIKKWELERFTALIDAFETELSQKVSHSLPYQNDYNNILIQIAGKAIMTANEILCLISNGLPDGALSLARNVYELYIILGFFENHKNDSDFQKYVEDYHLDEEIQKLKVSRWYAKATNNALEEAKLNAQLSEINKRKHNNSSRDYWWSGKQNFVEIQQEVELAMGNDKFQTMLHLLYKRACISLHANCLGNNIRIGSESSFIGVDNSAKTTGLAMPLYFLSCSLIPIIGVVCNAFNIEYEKYTEECNILAISYYKEWSNSNA